MSDALRTARVLIALLLACCCVGAVEAAEDARANQIKAAYLFNFVKFVEWPADATQEPIQICFVGAGGVYDSLRTATADKRVGARRIASRALRQGETAAGCTVVYFDADAMPDGGALLQSVRASSLTISDAQQFTRSGGVIQLFTEENRLRFVINVENARRAGLRISSNLLKLASNVEQDGAP